MTPEFAKRMLPKIAAQRLGYVSAAHGDNMADYALMLCEMLFIHIAEQQPKPKRRKAKKAGRG